VAGDNTRPEKEVELSAAHYLKMSSTSTPAYAASPRRKTQRLTAKLD